MRVLHVTHTLDPAMGGPPRVVARMAGAQALLGHEVGILCYESSSDASALREMTAHMPGFDEVKITTIASGGWAEKVFATKGRDAFSRLVDEQDVIHLYGFWRPLLAAAAKSARRNGVPYFFQPNGALDAWPMTQKWLKKKLAMTLVFRQLVKDSAGLCLGNEDERLAISRLGLPARTFVIPLNGLFQEEVADLPAAGSFYSRYPQLKQRPFIVYFGRLHHKKGLDYLAEGYSLFAKTNPDVQLVVIGHDEGAEADFIRRIERNEVRDRVHLMGPLHGQAKWEALRDASCFALTSRQEGFSIAITEALAAGLPAVISKECHFPEVAEFEAGAVVDLDPAAISHAFERVFSNEQRRLLMCQAAKDLVSTRYRQPEVARLLVQEYERLSPRHDESKCLLRSV